MPGYLHFSSKVLKINVISKYICSLQNLYDGHFGLKHIFSNSAAQARCFMNYTRSQTTVLLEGRWFTALHVLYVRGRYIYNINKYKFLNHVYLAKFKICKNNAKWSSRYDRTSNHISKTFWSLQWFCKTPFQSGWFRVISSPQVNLCCASSLIKLITN